MIQTSRTGISVIVCCYNSAARIGRSVLALTCQTFTSHVDWEVIIVDNACTDDTVSVAKSAWASVPNLPEMRVVVETKPGLVFARQKGIDAASYEYLLFCDDDNWLCEGYVEQMYINLSASAEVGACGGLGLPFFEIEKPEWFDEYAECFALGPQQDENISQPITMLYGAGMGMKQQVLKNLKLAGFKSWLQGRTGNNLSSAEDIELTYAIFLIGYKLVYDPKLMFQHFIPKERLTKAYLKKLFTAFGTDGPIRNAYYSNITQSYLHKQIDRWYMHLGLSLFRLCKYFVMPPKKSGRLIYFNWSMAYIRSLFHLRRKYSELQSDIGRIKRFNKGMKIECV